MRSQQSMRQSTDDTTSVAIKASMHCHHTLTAQELTDKLHATETKLRAAEDGFATARSDWEQSRTARRESLARSVQADADARIAALSAKNDETKKLHEAEITMMNKMHTLKVKLCDY